LGLAICHNICTALGARLTLSNRLVDGAVAGLDAEVRFPAPAQVRT
jgi:two-component system sensor histidine kinase TctE